MDVLVVTNNASTLTQLQSQLGLLPYIHSVAHKTLTELLQSQSYENEQNWTLSIIDASNEEATAQKLIEEWSGKYPQRWCVAIHERMDADLILGMVRAGAREFIQYPLDASSLNRIVERIYAQSKVISQQQELSQIESTATEVNIPRSNPGEIIAFFSPKGGGGSSTIALNTAYAINQLSKKTIIIDFNPQYEGFGHALNMDFKHAIGDIAKAFNTQSETLDENVIDKLIHKHSCGLCFIAMCKSINDDNPIASEELIIKILRILETQFEYIIVDCPSQWVENTHQLIFNKSKHMMITSMMDLPSLARTKEYLALVEHYLDLSKVQLILNRYNLSAAYSISNQKLEAAFEIQPYAKISNDWSLCVEASSLGQFLHKTSENSVLVKDIYNLALKITGIKNESNEKRNNSLTERFISKMNQVIRP
ncbi:MAG: AAA family ATPase [Vampirovibrionales bacterium]